jgi:hypothetical protein
MKKSWGSVGQMKLSFGMIFSIILMVIFLIFAFYAVQKFLDVGDCAKAGQFINKLESDVDKIWKGSRGSQEETYFLPSKVEFVCFVDYSRLEKGEDRRLYDELKRRYLEFENMFFYPLSSLECDIGVEEIKHIDLEKITSVNNPLCFDNIKGKVTMTLSKKYGEAEVTITK